MLPDHWGSLCDAVEFGGFNDAEETEAVARWARDEIERLRGAIIETARLVDPLLPKSADKLRAIALDERRSDG